MLCQESGSAAHAAPDVEDVKTLLQPGAFEEQFDQPSLGPLFGVGGVQEIAVMEVLAPNLTINLNWLALCSRIGKSPEGIVVVGGELVVMSYAVFEGGEGGDGFRRRGGILLGEIEFGEGRVMVLIGRWACDNVGCSCCDHVCT